MLASALTACAPVGAAGRAAAPTAARSAPKALVAGAKLASAAIAPPKSQGLDGVLRVPAPGVVGNNGGALLADDGIGLLTNNGGGFVSNNGGAFVSNNAGGLVSNNSGGFVSNNSGGLVSNNAGGLVSNNAGGVVAQGAGRYRGLLATRGRFVSLAGVAIFAYDEEGHQLSETPAMTDVEGRYRFARLPFKGRNVVLRASVELDGFPVNLEALAPAPQLLSMVTSGVDPATTFMHQKASELIRLGGVDRESLQAADVNAAAEALEPHMDDAVVSASVLLPAAYNAHLFDAIIARDPEARNAVARVAGTAAPLVATRTPERAKKVPATVVAVGEGVAKPLSVCPVVAQSSLAGVTRAPTFEVLAGTGTAGFSGDGGTATAATLNRPEGIAFDAAGNLYIADGANHRIRRRNQATGKLETLAGTGTPTSSGDGGLARLAAVESPHAVAVDATGQVYIVTGNRLRRIDVAGKMTTLAGDGTAGFGGDGGRAAAAQLAGPLAVALDASGVAYLSDRDNGRIRRVDNSPEDPRIDTVAGTGPSGAAGADGVALEVVLGGPFGLASDPSGGLYFAETVANRVRKLSADGTLTTIAGSGNPGLGGDGGLAAAADLPRPRCVARDAAGNLYISTECDRIRKITPGGFISTVASPGMAVLTNGKAARLTMGLAFGLAIDPTGALVVSDPSQHRVFRLKF